MSVRGSIKAIPCRNATSGRLPARSFPLAAWSSSGLEAPSSSGPIRPLGQHRSITSTRGKKTTTRTKLKKLAQGTLPALQDEPTDAIPERAYPRALQQHLNNIRKFPDCVVLTRIGDFYELYFEQVEQYAPLVNLKQATRRTSLGNVPMAGFQHTQLGRYLRMFVKDLGKQVAVSEQVPLADGDGGSGKFDRKVTRIVSAGTLIDEDFLDPNEANYLLAVHVDGPLPKNLDREETQTYIRALKVGLSWVDLSSGEFFTQVGNLTSLPSLIAGIKPSEIVLSSELKAIDSLRLQSFLGEGGYAIHFHETPNMPVQDEIAAHWLSMLERPLSDGEKEKFAAQETRAANMMLGFVRTKLMDMEIKLQPPIRKTDEEYMSIDRQSIRGLEIRCTLRDDKLEGSLLHAVRRTVTKSGSRLLARRLTTPSMSLAIINERLDLVQQMLESDSLREDVVALLRTSADVRRLLQRFSINKGDADDLLGLASTVDVMSQMASTLHAHIIASQEAEEADKHESTSCLWILLARFDLDDAVKVAKAITKAIDEEGLSLQHSVRDDQRSKAEDMAAEVEAADAAGDASPTLRKRPAPSSSDAENGEIWIMRRSASRTLQAAHADLEKLVENKHRLLLRLRKQLSTESLSFKWSAMLGHHCHVKTRNGAAPKIAELPGARTISSTKSTRTFYLAEWTELGVVMDDAKLRIRKEEERVFVTLRARVMENLMRLRRNASVLDELDVACSSATLAKERNLIRPHVNSSTVHHIVGGRHPTVDVGLTASGRQFTSNDCAVGSPSANIYLITGPNMGGKSTYLRQNALITILAQTGCYVPADYASIGLVDKIFSRVGSADNLYQDQSTFMVEMLETAEILKGATEKSFVIMDEVGRGTTPEDGIAVGYAALHHLHFTNKCRTLFATHFHDLADTTADFEGLQRWCTNIEEEAAGRMGGGTRRGEGTSDAWSYLHKLRPGVNRKSHALKVAKLAGVPEEAIAVAGEVLRNLEMEKRMRDVRGETGDRDGIRGIAAAAAG